MGTKIRRFEDSLSPASTFGGDKVTWIKDDEGNRGRGRGFTREDADRRAASDLRTKQQKKWRDA
jgi:hypothetical protein